MQKKISGANAWLVGWYGKTLKYCFRYQKSILLTAVVSMAATVFLFAKLPVNLIPAEDRGFFFAFVNLPAGMQPADISKQQTRLESLVKDNPNFTKFISLNFDGNLLYLFQLKPLHQRLPQQAVIAQVQQTFDAIPGIQTFIQPYQLINMDIDFGNAGQYQFVVRGLEFHDVEHATTTLTAELQSKPEFSFVQNTLNNDSPMLAMKINEEMAHRFGFDKQKIQGLLQSAFGQSEIGSIQKGATKEKIYMELLPDFQQSIDAPKKLFLHANDSFIPLKAFAEWHEKLGSPNLIRVDQLPAATIRFSFKDNISPNIGLQRVEEIAALTLPSNVSGVLSGSAKAVSSTTRDTLLLLLAAAVVMYIVLGILYESFIHPLTILSSIPFAGLGGILTLFLFNEPISIFSAVGFLLLIGIVKKNGIMMVDYAIEAKKDGITSEKAIYDACLVRFRPIMMTTVAAIMGAIPIAIGFGDGSEMRRGLGLVIAGGLLFSQVLTLYVTPIIYLAFDKLSKAKIRSNQSMAETKGH